MIFQGSSIYDITDEEIIELVSNHISERQHLEFKITVNYGEDEDRLEILRDIVSFANSGGGYIIIGIRDDGAGKAQKFEPESVGDIVSIKKSIASLCQDYISERIDGLEIVSREVNNNPLVILRIPSSERVPHMVNYKNRTDFFIRHNDGKREMTIGEIRELFTKDKVSLRLSSVEKQINLLLKKETDETKKLDILRNIKNKDSIDLLTIENGESLNELSYEKFKTEIANKPYMHISTTPKSPKPDLIDVDSEKIKNIFTTIPDLRPHGWTVMNANFHYQRIKDGISFGDEKLVYLKLLENGHSELWVIIDESFCWTQSKEDYLKQPKLYPIPVIEYPLSFLKYYKIIINLFDINDIFIINLNYTNIKGYLLNPYTRNMWGYLLNVTQTRVKKYPNEDLIVKITTKKDEFYPDKVTYKLLKRVYAAFGYESSKIFFYNKENEQFNIPY